jgi:hypothetical protein
MTKYSEIPKEYIKFLDNFPGSDSAAIEAIKVYYLYGKNKTLFIKMYNKRLDADYGKDFLKKVADYTFKNINIKIIDFVYAMHCR